MLEHRQRLFQSLTLTLLEDKTFQGLLLCQLNQSIPWNQHIDEWQVRHRENFCSLSQHAWKPEKLSEYSILQEMPMLQVSVRNSCEAILIPSVETVCLAWCNLSTSLGNSTRQCCFTVHVLLKFDMLLQMVGRKLFNATIMQQDLTALMFDIDLPSERLDA